MVNWKKLWWKKLVLQCERGGSEQEDIAKNELRAAKREILEKKL